MKRIAFFFIAGFVFGDYYADADQGTALEARLQALLSQFPTADLNHDGILTTDEFRQFKSSKPTASKSSSAASAEAKPDAISTTAIDSKLKIHIRSDKPIPINPKIYGINCAEMFIFDLVQKPEYLEALSELQFNTFLFPG